MIPQTPRALFLAFCQSHAPQWVTNAVGVGLTGPSALAYKEQVDEAVAAVLAAEQARNAAKAATAYANDLVSALKSSTATTVTKIRLFAEAAEKPSVVWQLADLTPPGPPAPVPAPAQPSDLAISINPTSGELTLKWKASNPAGSSGTSYIVRRRLPGETEFAFLGVTGTKSFTDTTLFAGPDSVQYTVQGQRAGLSSPVSAILTVNFGRLPGGGLTITGSESLAA
ncbi:MAG TPA: hypothetical protein VD997_15155 [Phycisphaerales bacterium]|nr:hypothetical protein [Phycisphaerales bacterium]